MLDDACPVHPVNVRQRDRLLARLVDTHVDEADVVVEAVAEDGGGDEGDDCRIGLGVSVSAPSDIHTFRSRWVAGSSLTVRQFLLVRNAALSVEGIVLGQVEGDVRVEGADDVFFDVERVDEAVEDLALDVFGRGVAGAVALVGAGAFGVEGAGVEARG